MEFGGRIQTLFVKPKEKNDDVELKFHPTLLRLIETVSANGLKPYLDARIIHCDEDHLKTHRLWLRHEVCNKANVDFTKWDPGSVMDCLWDIIANLRRPVISNEFQWMYLYHALVDDESGLDRSPPPPRKQIEDLVTQALESQRPLERFLLVNIIFMIKEMVKVE